MPMQQRPSGATFCMREKNPFQSKQNAGMRLYFAREFSPAKITSLPTG